jgi:hypothetical protein
MTGQNTAEIQQPQDTATETPTDVSEIVIAGRKLADFLTCEQDYPNYARCQHGTGQIAGYVVRETIRNHKVLWHGPIDEYGDPVGSKECGYDVFVVEGGCNYSDTFPVRDAYRRTPGGWAVVDHLYTCGHRSS